MSRDKSGLTTSNSIIVPRKIMQDQGDEYDAGQQCRHMSLFPMKLIDQREYSGSRILKGRGLILCACKVKSRECIFLGC